MKLKYLFFLLSFCSIVIFYPLTESVLIGNTTHSNHDIVSAQVSSSVQEASDNPDFLTPTPLEEEVPIILSNREIALSSAVLLFGVLVISFEFILVKGLGDKIKAQDFLNLFTITLIIVGTLFLISAGIDATHIAPALGLYGTIVGYLLGREAERDAQKKNKANNLNEN